MGVRGETGAEEVRRLELRGAEGVVGRCRDFTAAALADWGWTPARDEEAREVADDVLLLVSEVVTNACLHAGGPEEIVLRHRDGVLRVEVADPSPEHPRRGGPRPSSLPGGHGVMVLDRLAGRWGSRTRETGGGKVVWLEIAGPGAIRPPSDLRIPGA